MVSIRLYVSAKEVEPLLECLRNYQGKEPERRRRILNVLERVVLCTKLQGNIKASE